MVRHIFRLALVAATAALALGAGSASADSLLGGGCGSLAPVFAPWDDLSNYYFAPNGGFESGSAGWSLAGGAAVVGGNDAWYLHSAADSHALLIPAGGRAAISLCYGVDYPAVRFTVAGAGGFATVHVRVVTQNVLGIVSTLDGGTFTAGPGWGPAPKLSTLFSAVIAPFGAKTMQLQISSESGSALIDDLYVDPYLTK